MNSVYIDSATPATPIYIGPNNASSVVIGNANATTTVSINGITNIARNTTGTKGAYLECGSGNGNMVLDFHSSGLYDTDYDARIMASGGTSAVRQGTLQLDANTINIGAPNATVVTNLNGITNIARNTAGTNPTFIEIGSETNYNVIDFHCNSNYNRDYDARIVCAGGTSSEGQGDLSITSKSLSISCPLTLPTTYTAPTSGQLGYIISATIPTVWPGSQAGGTATLTVSPGVWLFTFNIYFTNTTATTNYLYTSESKYYGLTQLQGGSGWISSGSFVNSYTTTTTVGLSNYLNNAAVSDTNSFFKALRIA